MARLSYSEQLKHPNWQRKRLEVLNAHNFSCVECGCRDCTLHVHHKQYLKGRMAWEYELDNFETLCEECHKEAHERKDLLDRVVSRLPSSIQDDLVSLIIGFGEEYMESAEWPGADKNLVNSGRLAWHMLSLSDGESEAVVDCFIDLNPKGFMDVIKKSSQNEVKDC